MKWVLTCIVACFAICGEYLHAVPAIAYPIVNATGWFSFIFEGISVDPVIGGPSCVACQGSSCASPCPSNIDNPSHCQCFLPSKTLQGNQGMQWINNMMLNQENLQSFVITYRAYEDVSGDYVGTISITVYADFYRAPRVDHIGGNTVFFGINFVDSMPNNALGYTGPNWSIRIEAI